MNKELMKPVIGFTCGDVNGIGPELLIKALGGDGIGNFCTPVIFAGSKVVNFYKKKRTCWLQRLLYT